MLLIETPHPFGSEEALTDFVKRWQDHPAPEAQDAVKEVQGYLMDPVFKKLRAMVAKEAAATPSTTVPVETPKMTR